MNTSLKYFHALIQGVFGLFVLSIYLDFINVSKLQTKLESIANFSLNLLAQSP